MKLKLRVDCQWRVYCAILCFSILWNSDVSAVTHKRSPSKPSLSSSSPIRHGTSANANDTTGGKGIPSSILAEIRSLDNQLLCFPKLLCTIYQDDSITKRHISFNATELGVAYIKLLRAVHYASPTASATTVQHTAKLKRPIIQIFQIPTGLIKSTTYPGRKDHLHSDDLEDYPHHLRSPLLDVDHDDVDAGDGDDYSLESRNNPLGDEDEDREFLREKLEISQMMQDLKQEDEEESAKDSTSRDSLLPSFISSFLPFMGSRSLNHGSQRSLRRNYSRKSVQVITPSIKEGKRKARNLHDVPQDPFWKAVGFWKTLKSRSECYEMYKTCPFEAWEVVRMLDLVKGQSKVLSAYLKITVDKVQPGRIRT